MSRDIALNIAINAGQAISQAEQLREELEATEQAATQPVVLTADDQASPVISEVVDLIALVGREPARVVLTADVAEAQAAFDTALARMDDIAGLSDAMVLDFQVDFEDARTELEMVEEKLRTLDAMDTTVKARAEVDAAVTDIDSVAEKLASLDGADTEVIVAARNEAKAELERIDAALVVLDGQTAEAVVTARDAARKDLEYVQGELTEIDGRLVEAGVTVETAGAVGGLRQVGDEAGRSRQALGQVGGEAIQQFGSMLGPLQGVSYELGTVADQALSGRSNLGQMAATAGPLVGVGLAVGIIGNELKKSAEAKAFDRETVDSYKEAISGAGDEVADFVARLTDAGKVIAALGTGTDITGALAAAGVGISEYTQLVMAGTAAVDEWAVAQTGGELAGSTFTNTLQIARERGDEVATAYAGMSEEAKLYAQAQKEAKEATEFFLGSSDDLDLLTESYRKLQDPISQLPDEFARIGQAIDSGVTPSADDLRRVTTELGISIPEAFDLGTEAAGRQRSSLESLIGLTGELQGSGVAGAEAAVAAARDMAAAAADRAAEATQREVDALRDNVTVLDDRVDAQRGAVDAGYALADSQDAFAQATVTATQAMNAGTPGEQAAAYRNLAQSAQLVADNTVRVAEETATANGQSLSRKQSIDIENGALLAQAGTLTGPMRAALVEHIGRINGIPPKKISEIQALIDQGKIGEAEGLLTRASRTRDAAIKATADEKEAEGKLTETARKRAAEIAAKAATAGAESDLLRTERDRVSDIVGKAATAVAEGQLTHTERNRTAEIFGDADTALAEQKLARTAAARRRAEIAGDADTQLAEQKLARTAAAPREATIDTDAKVERAVSLIRQAANASYPATIETSANVDQALEIIRGAANASYPATITATARDAASGDLDAIASTVRYARITAIVGNIVERT